MDDQLIDKQMEHWLVCQFCGRSAPRGADRWLDSPMKGREHIRIVRCPAHWSEWALRRSMMGRTNEARRQMRENAEWAAQQLSYKFTPYMEPFPTVDKPLD